MDLPLVFVGYGITARAEDYDDYAGVEVAGKAVVVLRHQPWRADAARSELTADHAPLRRKLSNAFAHGAAAVIFVTDRHTLRQRKPHDDSLMPFGVAGFRCSHRDLAVFHCRREVLEPAIRTAYKTDLAAVEGEINRDFAPHSRELPGWRIRGRTDIQRIESPAKNVIALLPGQGPAVNETIVVGSHYDHFGYTEVQAGGKTKRVIYSGADDNASGVAAMLEIARHLAEGPRRPRRQVLFVAFSAEERGLRGSIHYVCHPVVPLARTVAMINLDMVGRLHDNKLYVRGVDTAEGWRGLLERLNTRHNLGLVLQDRLGKSDQLSFYAEHIPILHFFTGRHADYHEATDTFEKINTAGLRRITRLAEDVVGSLAEVPGKPVPLALIPPEEQDPYLGVFQDFTCPDAGYSIGPVVKDGPAERAGLRDGDLIVQLGQEPIASATDFEEAASHHRGGDRVRLVVKRGNQSRSVELILGSGRPISGKAASGN